MSHFYNTFISCRKLMNNLINMVLVYLITTSLACDEFHKMITFMRKRLIIYYLIVNSVHKYGRNYIVGWIFRLGLVRPPCLILFIIVLRSNKVKSRELPQYFGLVLSGTYINVEINWSSQCNTSCSEGNWWIQN